MTIRYTVVPMLNKAGDPFYSVFKNDYIGLFGFMGGPSVVTSMGVYQTEKEAVDFKKNIEETVN